MGRQRCGRRTPVRHRRPCLRNQSRAIPHLRAAPGSCHDLCAAGRIPAAPAPAAATARGLLRCESADGSACHPADQVRTQRKPLASDNPFVALQEGASHQIVATLDAWRVCCETLAERTFLSIYGSPTLQAAVGIDPTGTRPLRKAARQPLHRELLQKRVAELEAAIPAGGLAETVVRGLPYAGMSRALIDERGFKALRLIRHAHTHLTLAEFKALVREQFNILLINQEAALAAIPRMLPNDAKARRNAFELIRRVLGVRGALSTEDAARLAEVARLFGLDEGEPPGPSRVRRPPKGALRRAPADPVARQSLTPPACSCVCNPGMQTSDRRGDGQVGNPSPPSSAAEVLAVGIGARIDRKEGMWRCSSPVMSLECSRPGGSHSRHRAAVIFSSRPPPCAY